MSSYLEKNRFAEWLQQHLGNNRQAIFVAYSGGVDSHVLLHLLAQTYFAKRVVALHADHGWHKDSNQWAEHCAVTCKILGVPFRSTTLEIADRGGYGLEAAARNARYQWFAQEVGSNVLLTAHHQNDQAETFLLRALRGAGSAGLGAIKSDVQLGNMRVLRPLLETARSEIERYAQAYNFKWVQDDANEDLHFARNYLRHKIFPVLQKRWPAAATLLARAASLSQQSQAVLNEIGDQDLSLCRSKDVAGVLYRQRPLLISVLCELTPARRNNVLRYWWHDVSLKMPSEKIMHTIEQTFFNNNNAKSGCVSWGNTSLHAYRNALFLLPRNLPPLPQLRLWKMAERPILKQPSGTIIANGFPENAVVNVRPRNEGERVRLPGRSHRHSLKKLYQSAGVPPWERDLLPLLELNGESIYAFGIGALAAWPGSWPVPDKVHLQITIEINHKNQYRQSGLLNNN